MLGATLGFTRLLRALRAATPDIESSAVMTGLLAATVAGAVHAMLSGIIVMPLSQIAGAVVLGWAWAESQGDERLARQVTGEQNVRVRSFAIVCAVLLSVAVFPDLRTDRVGSSERSVLRETHFRPRVWLQGRSNYSLTRKEGGGLPIRAK
jgi:hypothetical protein